MNSRSFLKFLNQVPLGTTSFTWLPLTESSLGSPLKIPVAFLQGSFPGPCGFITATIHGDETNSVDIVQKLIQHLDPKNLCGSLLLFPLVNISGFFMQSRYLPPHKDLNRFFPGNSLGNTAERMAAILFSILFKFCNFGIDLHTAGKGHLNLPHIRGDLSQKKIKEMAQAFGASIVMNQKGVAGSLRYELSQRNVPTLLFEAGEAGRFSRQASEVGLRGILNVLKSLKVIQPSGSALQTRRSPILIEKSSWIRAKKGGILHLLVQPGEFVLPQAPLANVSDPFGKTLDTVTAPFSGIVIGITTNPQSIPGASLIHLAYHSKTKKNNQKLDKNNF